MWTISVTNQLMTNERRQKPEFDNINIRRKIINVWDTFLRSLLSELTYSIVTR